MQAEQVLGTALAAWLLHLGTSWPVAGRNCRRSPLRVQVLAQGCRRLGKTGDLPYVEKAPHWGRLAAPQGSAARMRALGVPMFPHCIWRSEAEQERLFKGGFTKVLYPHSAHNRGCAVDVIHSTKAWNLTESQWQIVGHVGRELAASKGWKLVWGGDDPGVDDAFDWDPAHWELERWRSHAMVRPQPPVRATR